MASKRWESVIEKFAEQERYCLGSDILYREDVAKLLARQHAAFVRLVRKKLKAKDTRGKTGVEIHVGLDRDAIDHFNHGFEYACEDILAALADERRRADEEAKRLRECLVEVNRVLQDPESTGISDTIWYNDMITLVEFIDGVLGENPDQQELPIAKARAGQEG